MNKQAYEHIVGLVLEKQAANGLPAGYTPPNPPDTSTAMSQMFGGLRQSTKRFPGGVRLENIKDPDSVWSQRRRMGLGR